jgi:hypothetical protein
LTVRSWLMGAGNSSVLVRAVDEISARPVGAENLRHLV